MHVPHVTRETHRVAQVVLRHIAPEFLLAIVYVEATPSHQKQQRIGILFAKGSPATQEPRHTFVGDQSTRERDDSRFGGKAEPQPQSSLRLRRDRSKAADVDAVRHEFDLRRRDAGGRELSGYLGRDRHESVRPAQQNVAQEEERPHWRRRRLQAQAPEAGREVGPGHFAQAVGLQNAFLAQQPGSDDGRHAQNTEAGDDEYVIPVSKPDQRRQPGE